jgi:hypothetical protein
LKEEREILSEKVKILEKDIGESEKERVDYK